MFGVQRYKKKFMRDLYWANKFLPEIKRILKTQAIWMISVQVATPDEDMSLGVDMVIRVEGGNVAVRIRRARCRWRDITIRIRRPSGVPTEIDKIKVGYVSWYLYAWTYKNQITEWVLVDVRRIVELGVFERRWKSFSNRDGTRFIVIPISRLLKENCIVAYTLHTTQRYREQEF